jgi:hypothetical protein
MARTRVNTVTINVLDSHSVDATECHLSLSAGGGDGDEILWTTKHIKRGKTTTINFTSAALLDDDGNPTATLTLKGRTARLTQVNPNIAPGSVGYSIVVALRAADKSGKPKKKLRSGSQIISDAQIIVDA